MQKKNEKVVWRIGVFFGILVVFIFAVTMALLPKIPDFYKEDRWDVLFFGTSQCYCSFNPAVFDEYDLKTYNRGRQQQPLNYTYYYIKDALEVSEVDIVVLETYALTYWEGHDAFWDAGVRDSSLNDMRYSRTKYDMIFDCVDEENRISYLFPLDKYHSNWENLNYDTVGTFFTSLTERYYTEESERGFFPWNAVQEAYYLPENLLNSEERREIYALNMEYLERIYELCEKNNIELVLVRTPLPCESYIIETMNTLKDWAEEKEVIFINYMDLTEELKMDWTKDSLDGGVHLNMYGAEKVSRHLAEYLSGLK